jgi:hypothetical protein
MKPDVTVALLVTRRVAAPLRQRGQLARQLLGHGLARLSHA